MKQRPLILITTSTQRRGAEFCDRSLSLSHCYSLALAAAGGLPWVLPSSLDAMSIDECVRRCDGLMLTGGEDVQPALYGASLPSSLKRTLGPPDPARDLAELQVLQAVFQHRKPLLAICRGQQILNVALGGSLVVDIASQIPQALKHQRSEAKNRLVHDIDLTPDSLLARVVGRTTLGVNSSHHQAVAQVARPLRVTATSADGVVEALELEPAAAGYLPYLLAVQFHPERLWQQHSLFLDLFRSFTGACAGGGP